MKIKLCGFTDLESVKTAIAEKCDFLGFVFCANSVRKISPKDAALLAKEVPATIKKVAVVVDADVDLLQQIYEQISPDVIQFHGHESPEFLRDFRKKFPQIKIIKAFRISYKEDLAQIKDFEDYVDYFLFDAKSPGSGKSFDWRILHNLSTKKNWFLSGGLNVSNIDEALEVTGASYIDLSSGIEEIRGHKSSRLIQEFMKKVKSN